MKEPQPTNYPTDDVKAINHSFPQWRGGGHIPPPSPKTRGGPYPTPSWYCLPHRQSGHLTLPVPRRQGALPSLINMGGYYPPKQIQECVIFVQWINVVIHNWKHLFKLVIMSTPEGRLSSEYLWQVKNKYNLHPKALQYFLVKIYEHISYFNYIFGN